MWKGRTKNTRNIVAGDITVGVPVASTDETASVIVGLCVCGLLHNARCSRQANALWGALRVRCTLLLLASSMPCGYKYNEKRTTAPAVI